MIFDPDAYWVLFIITQGGPTNNSIFRGFILNWNE